MNLFRRKHAGKRAFPRGHWAGVKVHAALTAMVVGTLLWPEPRVTLVLGGTLCFVTYGYLGFKEAQAAPLWLSPLSFYFFWYCIGMGASPLYLGLRSADGEMVRFASASSMVTLEDLALGYVLFLVGSLMLHLGLQIFRPVAKSEGESTYDRHILAWWAAVWLGGLLFQFSPGSFSFLGATVKILSVAVVGSVCGFAVTSRKSLGLSRYVYAVILMIGTAGLFFGNLASGSKAYIMFSFLPLFWLFTMNKRLRVWIPGVALVLGMFYLGLVAPVVQTSRMSPLEEGENPRERLIDTFEAWNREKPQELDQSFLADQLDQFLSRQFDAVPVGFMVGEVAGSGLLLGETMKYASYAFIPRLLWPDKPTVTRGGWFSTYLGASDTEAEATTAIGMTAVGELYWNFGTLGVLIGMLAIGCFQGILWRMAGADPRSKPIHMLLYVSLLFSMPDMPEAVTVFVSLTVAFLTFKAAFVVIDLFYRRRNRETAILRPQILSQ